MQITVVSKIGCAKCMAAKAKLQMMHLPYDEKDVNDYRVEQHAPLPDTDLPLVIIDGVPLSYPAAMKHLKGIH